MYYEDENNLYHYSYRKGGRDVEPVYNTRNYAEEPAEPAPPPKKKGGALKLAALMLVCALTGGVIGAGALSCVQGRTAGSGTTTVAFSSRGASGVEAVKVEAGGRQLTLPEIYAANIDSVVSINTTVTRNVYGQSVQNAAAGSGFIISADGYILTNYHVVEGANTVKVTLYSGDTYDAAIIGGDEDYDIAVLKIDAEELQNVTIGDSSALVIGETVAAIGNPLGELTFSMSEGIVSCVDRAINVDGTPFNMIQTTAAINPGNSGGPLFNSYGEVIGIVSAKYSTYSNTVVEGLGFAIPINDVIAMIEDIMTNGYVTNKPFIGITPGTMTERMARQYRYDVTEGVFVYSVEAGSAADKAGLRMGDVILGIDDKEIADANDLTAAKKDYSAGDTAAFTIYRDGRTFEVELTFDAAPQNTAGAQQPPQYGQDNGSGGYYGGYRDPWEFFNNFFDGFGGRYYGNSYEYSLDGAA